MKCSYLSSSSTPCWMDKGSNAWMMVAAILAGLATMPGLLLLYSGIARKKWAVNTAFLTLYAFTASLICWVTICHNLAFGSHLLPFWGTPGPVLYTKFLLSRSQHPATHQDLDFPSATMVAFQFGFAANSVAIVSSAVSARITFQAWAVFVPLWLIFSYTVGASSIWSGGFFSRWGVLDFAGGYVVHLSAGVSGAVLAHWVGPRHPVDRARYPPNNVMLVLAGAGLVWLGWIGFAGGSAFLSPQQASLAVVNTNIAAATSLLVWTSLDVFYHGQPSVLGAVQGLMTGLVAISPAAGLVEGWASMCIGLCSGSLPWLTRLCHQKTTAKFCEEVDDTAGAVHTHGIAALIGVLLTGFFAHPRLTAMVSPVSGSEGVIFGNFQLVLKQLAAALLVILWNVAVTTLICVVVKRLMKLRMSDDQLRIGDDAVHGEEAYAVWEDGEKTTL
ncbi:hypothetical protein SELMODRAFT_108685 [Selaginella moellendorffii]|uniref:Ammonium transporter n=1 Tax=Selaginella moellendorffii TaxID=88036 RepID=D8S5E8_SELML|nr:hypothetical protein SELMODRAFT_108685 [Selaginella moellendorffii]